MAEATDLADFEVWQTDADGDSFCAGTSGPRDRAFAEAQHYAAVYGQDGPTWIVEVIRKRVDGALPLAATGGKACQ